MKEGERELLVLSYKKLPRVFSKLKLRTKKNVYFVMTLGDDLLRVVALLFCKRRVNIFTKLNIGNK
jgi:hypothetical protein